MGEQGNHISTESTFTMCGICPTPKNTQCEVNLSEDMNVQLMNIDGTKQICERERICG